MELRQLEYFVAVAHEKSFTLAAKRLHVVQSAVSAAIAALEKDLKVTLFERSAQRVVLTEAGAALLPEALAVQDAVQGARDVVDELGSGLRGHVRVAMLGGLALVDLPAVAGVFRTRYPGVELQLRVEATGSSGNLAALLAGDCDVAFLALAAPPHRDLASWELVRVPNVLAVPVGHRLARRRRVALADLADESFVDFPPGFTNRAIADQVFEAAGISRRIAVEVAGVDDAAAFVRHEVGVAILPEYAARLAGDVRILRVDGQSFEWAVHVAMLRKRRPSAAVRALLGLVMQHVRLLDGTVAGADLHR
ncbi:LysR family transcriptional regulator [Jiangella rhizosphaerae]|uniref:LysR family transcriptional regulator n=1 Tax=Jiangella rhizosphaerae TaxID=2293569 RepID=A0A418KQ08_9ACTN|nr:LysR family transcriptional regulator [Jiangella rhizosphaerae]RIQ21866.1 LysR family transcriptional regulator [Jiangella rhizosphaerae]